MTGTIDVTRDGAIATVVLNRPEKLNALTRAMWRDLGDGDRRAVGRRQRALHRFARRRRARVLAGQRHRRVQPRALEQGAGDRVRRGHAHHCTRARGVPPSDGRPDPRHLRRRRARDRRAVRPAHLRREQPLRRTDQESRPRDGLCGDGAARAAVRCRTSRSRSCSKAASSTPRRRRTSASSRAWWRTPRSQAKRALRRRASPRARRWSRAGTSSSPGAWHEPAPLTAAEQDACFDCFDTEDFREGYAAFLAKRKPDFVGR